MRGISGALGFLGGLITIFGGIVAFVYGVGYAATGQPSYVITSTFVSAVAAIILGIIILIVTGTTHMRVVWASAGIAGGIILIILGIVTWIFFGHNWIIVAGAILTIVGGLIEAIAAAVFRAHRAAEAKAATGSAPPPSS